MCIHSSVETKIASSEGRCENSSQPVLDVVSNFSCSFISMIPNSSSNMIKLQASYLLYRLKMDLTRTTLTYISLEGTFQGEGGRES